MKTKIIILGQEPKEEKKLKPIEFKRILMDGGDNVEQTKGKCRTKPSDWDNIELICKNYGDCDLFFVYQDGKRNNGCLFIGHFNDGVVE